MIIILFLPANPPWKSKLLNEKLKFDTLIPNLIQIPNKMTSGAMTRPVNRVEMTGGGRRSGSRNICLISGRIPLIGAAGEEVACAAAGPVIRSSASARVHLNGLLMIASPMINSTLYFPDLMPNSDALLPIS